MRSLNLRAPMRPNSLARSRPAILALRALRFSLGLGVAFAIGCNEAVLPPEEATAPEMGLAELYEAGRFADAIPLQERRLIRIE